MRNEDRQGVEESGWKRMEGQDIPYTICAESIQSAQLERGFVS